MPKNLTVIGNWKMFKTSREAADYVAQLLVHLEGCKTHVGLAVPYTSIATAAAAAKQSALSIGAQNMNDAREGAFTGEIAALMLKEAGAEFVIVGHSERRHIFGEQDEWIHRKVVRALQDDLKVVLCVGETAQERSEGKTEEVLERQLSSALADVPKEHTGQILVAYEPVWAIGSGTTATPSMVQGVHAFCRKCLASFFGKRKAAAMSLLYGGSVTSDNVEQLVLEKDVDGVLVGGASLDPHSLFAIIQHCEKV